ncbi:hypothetical protein B0T17DRAFT_531194 [Bombardia bombarda]|uniref:Uncharacterized protein n=1 Tax=Bombardia bombarda TaxID=252184 RepID=A0AA40C4L2_9PEZI|nr:hypothetical protein B0T17DRAFT_531194 [Bombardia bombarda]
MRVCACFGLTAMYLCIEADVIYLVAHIFFFFFFFKYIHHRLGCGIDSMGHYYQWACCSLLIGIDGFWDWCCG